jgi:hypothetical protein
MNFINTTPHPITLKTTKNYITIKSTPNEELFQVFRGTTTSTKLDDLNTNYGEISTTSSPVYEIDQKLFYKTINPSVPTIFIISSISGEMIKKLPLEIKNARFMVPYTGPDTSKCYRENGEIKWCSELMEYKPEKI